jgi:hypothetical protein
MIDFHAKVAQKIVDDNQLTTIPLASEDLR